MSQATLSDRPYVNSALFSSHYLDERVTEREEWNCDPEAREAMNRLQSLYDLEGDVVDGYGEDALVDNWIDEVLDVLGYGTQKEVTLPGGDGYVDELLFGSSSERRDAAKVNLDTQETTDLFTRGIGLVEAKQWNADFTEEFSERRPYRNASHQIKHYLEKTPANIQWGVLTNGRKWRLYGTKDYETQTYFEIDLPEILESGDLDAFKYFYVFFRPAAFRETAGTTFLDEVRSESETASQELGEDLQDNVFTALRVLGRGFVESNDMDINPADEAALEELKEQSLVLLYRLMFVLYAEARELIHPEEPATQDEYAENFSLDALRLEIHDEIGEVDEGFESAFSEYSTTMWSRLEDLFSLIDKGEEDLGIPAYNGGLFDHDQHAFLTNHEVSNRYLAEVIYRLSTTENDDGRYVLADYADLDTRHLGSVYEGLLEHHFRIAPEQYAAVAADGGQVWKPASEVTVADAVETVPAGGLYVVNDEGERKATGAYYTPDYVVTYIVEETIGPLVAEIHEGLESQGFERGTQEYIGPFIRRVTDLQILDPAMGSGHFLTRATEYLANEVMVEVREVESEMGVAIDEQQMRRDIAKECIYGVDINGMAVELAKLSMWLETLATDQPLAFLDHHLKAGNSLVGSDVTDVLSEDDEEDGGQLTLTQAFGRVRRDTLDHVMDLMADLLAMDNETLEDIHSMEDLYAEIQDDPLYRRLFELTNVHTAEQFGVSVPEDAYEQMAGAIEDESEWAAIQEENWFEDAQTLADEQTFFHWELEYPGVFFDEDGEEREDAGFDAVIGNPPYAQIPAGTVETMYGSGPSDLYAQFMLSMPELISSGSHFSFIAPTSWETGPAYQSVREKLLERGSLESLINLPYDVFADAYVDTAIFVWEKDATPGKCSVVDRSGTRINPALALSELDFTPIPVEKWKDIGFIATNEAWLRISASIDEEFSSLGEMTNSTRGVLVTDEALEDENANTPILLDSFLRYEPVQSDSNTKWEKLEERPPDIDWFEDERLLIRRLVSRSDRLLGTMASERFVTKKDTYIFKSESVPIPILLSIVNSQFISWWHFNVELAASKDDFRQVTLSALRDLPMPHNIVGASSSVDEKDFKADFERHLDQSVDKPNLRETMDYENFDFLYNLPKILKDLQSRRNDLNTNLLDFLQPYTDGPTLDEIGVSQPSEGVKNTILTATKEDYENLRIGRVLCKRENENVVEIRLTARYKPDGPDDYETDQWGYTETEPLPALRISDLTDAEADLIEHFVPVAVDEAGGFADFRKTATKTNSPVDRLRKLTLPVVEDVREGLESYVETKERADELEAKIERTDDLIDEIVYELYGLTDEEIEIVEEAVGE